MKAADAFGAEIAPREPAQKLGAADPALSGLNGRARLGAALLGIAIAVVAAAVCALLGVLLAQAIFGTTGGIL